MPNLLLKALNSRLRRGNLLLHCIGQHGCPLKKVHDSGGAMNKHFHLVCRDNACCDCLIPTMTMVLAVTFIVIESTIILRSCVTC